MCNESNMREEAGGGREEETEGGRRDRKRGL
jgi:hypothetical protein